MTTEKQEDRQIIDDLHAIKDAATRLGKLIGEFREGNEVHAFLFGCGFDEMENSAARAVAMAFDITTFAEVEYLQEHGPESLDDIAEGLNNGIGRE